jgi:hypothetical protein
MPLTGGTMGSGRGVLTRKSAAPRSMKSNGGAGQTLADPETTATDNGESRNPSR